MSKTRKVRPPLSSTDRKHRKEQQASTCSILQYGNLSTVVVVEIPIILPRAAPRSLASFNCEGRKKEEEKIYRIDVVIKIKKQQRRIRTLGRWHGKEKEGKTLSVDSHDFCLLFFNVMLVIGLSQLDWNLSHFSAFSFSPYYLPCSNKTNV